MDSWAVTHQLGRSWRSQLQFQPESQGEGMAQSVEPQVSRQLSGYRR